MKDASAVILVRDESQVSLVMEALRPLGLQRVDPSLVVKALRAAHVAPMTPDVFVLQNERGPVGDGHDGEQLTPRERQMLRLIASGLTNKEIAESLYLSDNSVKSYVRNAYRKIGVNTRSRAVIWWYENHQLGAGS